MSGRATKTWAVRLAIETTLTSMVVALAVLPHRPERRRARRRLEDDHALACATDSAGAGCRDARRRPHLDVEPFLLEEAFVVGHPDRREIQRVSRTKDHYLVIDACTWRSPAWRFEGNDRSAHDVARPNA